MERVQKKRSGTWRICKGLLTSSEYATSNHGYHDNHNFPSTATIWPSLSTFYEWNSENLTPPAFAFNSSHPGPFSTARFLRYTWMKGKRKQKKKKTIARKTEELTHVHRVTLLQAVGGGRRDERETNTDSFITAVYFPINLQNLLTTLIPLPFHLPP